MTTPSEKYMRTQIDKRRDEITQKGCEYDGPVGDAMERAVETYKSIAGGWPVYRGPAIWSARDIMDNISEHAEIEDAFREAISGLFRNPTALSLAMSMLPAYEQHFRALSDAIQMAAGVMCGDLACESIISDQDEAGRP